MMRYPTFVFFNFFFVLSAYVMAYPLAAFSLWWGPVLPGFLRYWSTLDDDLDGGQHQQPDIYPSGVKGWKLLNQRAHWICRNPAQGWQCKVLGFLHEGSEMYFNEEGGKEPYFGMGNHYRKYKIRAANGTDYWGYRRDIRLWGDRFVKVWFGWHYEAKDGKYHKLQFQPFSMQRLPK